MHLGMVIWHSDTWHRGSFCKLLSLFSSEVCSKCCLYPVCWLGRLTTTISPSGHLWAKLCLSLVASSFGKLLFSLQPWLCDLNEDCYHFVCPKNPDHSDRSRDGLWILPCAFLNGSCPLWWQNPEDAGLQLWHHVHSWVKEPVFRERGWGAPQQEQHRVGGGVRKAQVCTSPGFPLRSSAQPSLSCS